MKTFNGYEVVDAKARQDIASLKDTHADSYFLDFSQGLLNQKQPATEQMCLFAQHIRGSVAGDTDACAYIKDTHDDNYYPATISYGWNNGTFIIYLTKTGVNLNNIAAGMITEWDTVQLTNDAVGSGWNYQIMGSGNFTFASQQYVLKAIADSATGDVDLSGYYTKEETDTALEGKADKEHTHSQYLLTSDHYSWELDFVATLEEEYYNKAMQIEKESSVKNNQKNKKTNFETHINMLCFTLI